MFEEGFDADLERKALACVLLFLIMKDKLSRAA